MATQGQKQALVAAADPLNDAGILRQVFTFLPGTWLFLGAVCSEWTTIYASTAAKQVRSFTLHGISRLVTCGAKTTLYNAAVASPAAARLAYECGLANMISHNSRLQMAAGLRADIQTLTALGELGMPLSASLANAVARSGRLEALQQLLTGQVRPVMPDLGHHAARSGSISMLNWLRFRGLVRF
jgi:hypothetical protein